MVSHTDTGGPSPDRRSFLVAAGGAVVGSSLATGTAAAARPASFHVTQGEKCIPVRPLRGDRPVKQFYDYRMDRYASHGTRSLQRPNTSILFLYDGPNGVSLVVVHGKLGGTGDGGSITFDVSGLPESGDWLVRDDSYEGANRYDRWDIGETTATIDWTYDGRRADGAVFGPLGDAAIQIDPAFNERAALFGKHYDGTILDWQVLSGDRSNPKRTPLDRSKPITIASGGCPAGTRGSPTRPGTTGARTTRSTTRTAKQANQSKPTQSPPSGGTTPTPDGSGGELDGFLDQLARFFDQLARFLNRLARSLKRLL